MPKDSLFPPGPGNYRVVRLTANSIAHAGMLGAIVDLAGFQLALNTLAGSGTMIVLGSGTTSGGIVRTLSANQAMQVTLLDNTWHLSDSPDLSAINAHLSSTANPHNVTKAQVGLGSVDNTADANKPVSSAQQAAIDAAKNRANHTGTQAMSTVEGLSAALNGKAPLASPTFTGTPSGPTAPPGTNTTQFATTAFVVAAMSGLGSGGGSWGSITGDITAQSDLMGYLAGISADIANKADSVSPVFSGTVTFNAAAFSYSSSPDAAEAHRTALNAQVATIQRTSPPLNTGSFGKSTLTFSGNIVTSGQVSLNGVAIQFIGGLGPYPSYSLIFDQWPYNGTVTPTQAAAFVTNTINRNQEVFGCQAVDNGDGTVLVVALVSGPSGNSIATTDNLNVASWSAATLTGGSIMGTNVTGTPGKVGQKCVVTYDAAAGITQTYTCIRETPVLWQRTASLGIPHIEGLKAALDAKQAMLYSGINIKTVGGVSLLGAGDVPSLTEFQIQTRLGEQQIAALRNASGVGTNPGVLFLSSIRPGSFLIGVKTSTGYGRLILPDGTLGVQQGDGVAANQFTLEVPVGSGLRSFAVMSVANGGSVRSGNVTSIDCQSKSLVVADIASCTALTYVDLFNNLLTSLAPAGFSSLAFFSASTNKLASLAFTNCAALTHVTISGNLFTAAAVDVVFLSLPAAVDDNAGYWESSPAATSVSLAKRNSMTAGGWQIYA